MAPEHTPELLSAYGRTSDPTRRADLLEALAEGRSELAFDVLVDALYGDDPEDSERAAAGLQKLDTKAARWLLWEFRNNRAGFGDATA